MNFTTDLPKKDPIVSYIVASAVKCEKFFPGAAKEGPVFRMHAVILKRNCNPLRALGPLYPPFSLRRAPRVPTPREILPLHSLPRAAREEQGSTR